MFEGASQGWSPGGPCYEEPARGDGGNSKHQRQTLGGGCATKHVNKGGKGSSSSSSGWHRGRVLLLLLLPMQGRGCAGVAGCTRNWLGRMLWRDAR
jgi:hypothetical protein